MRFRGMVQSVLFPSPHLTASPCDWNSCKQRPSVKDQRRRAPSWPLLKASGKLMDTSACLELLDKDWVKAKIAKYSDTATLSNSFICLGQDLGLQVWRCIASILKPSDAPHSTRMSFHSSSAHCLNAAIRSPVATNLATNDGRPLWETTLWRMALNVHSNVSKIAQAQVRKEHK